MKGSEFIEKMISFKGNCLNYVEINEKSKKPETILLIHGISSNWRDWKTSLLSQIATLGYRTIVIDRPGMGQSIRDKAIISLEDQSSLIIEIIQRLDVKSLIILGHSYGGSLSLQMAIKYPSYIQGLLLLGTPTHPWKGGLGLLYDILGFPLLTKIGTQVISFLKPKRLIETTLKDVFCPQPVPYGYKEALNINLTLRKRSLEWIIKDAKDLKSSLEKLSHSYSRLKVPVKIIHCLDDKIVPFSIHAKELHKKIPSSVLVKLERTGHMPHHFAKDIILSSLKSLLAES